MINLSVNSRYYQQVETAERIIMTFQIMTDSTADLSPYYINATINVIANVTIPPIYNPKAAINTKMIPLISLCLNINLYSSKSAVASIIVFDRLY